MTAAPFGTRLIGQTEKTLSAVLDRLLAGSGVTEPQWVAMATAHAARGGTSVETIAATLQRPVGTVSRDVVPPLVERGMFTMSDDVVDLTDQGRAFVARIRERVEAITTRLWGDLPEEDLATAASILSQVQSRAARELAALS